MAGRMAAAAAVIIVVIASLTIQVWAGLPDTIRVGLKYDATAPSSVRVSSSSGIEFGINTGSGFIGLYIHAGKGNVHVRKDGYFADSKGLLIEINSADAPPSGLTFGPYHLQVSEVFPDRQQAEMVLQQIAGQGLEGFIVYDNGWRVWTGRYITEQEMEGHRLKLRDKLGGAYEVYPVYPSGGRLQLNDDAGKPLFMFEGANQFLVSRPLDGSHINVDGKIQSSINLKGMGRQYNGGQLLPLQHYLYGVVPRELNRTGTWKC